MLVFFILGASVASFLNVLIWAKGDFNSWFRVHSVCDSCKKTLAAPQLIPILGWVIQGGRCKYCKEKISIIHPLSELSLGLAFAFVFRKFGSVSSLSTLYSLVVISCLYFFAVFDLKHGVVPNKFVIPLIFVFLFYRIFVGDYLLATLLVTLVLYLFFFFLGLWGAFGMGDSKFVALLSLMLGWNYDRGPFLFYRVPKVHTGIPFAIVAVYLGFIIGGIFALGLLVAGKAQRKTKLPLVPFLATGAAIVLLR